MDILEELFKLQDKEYARFHCKLTPNLDESKVIGVRVPELRKIAKTIIKNGEADTFLNSLPHQYNEENMLHSIIVSEIKEWEKAVEKLEEFLPYVDNWAVCDTISPKAFKKYRKNQVIIEKIIEWLKSNETYTCRFGLNMIMSYYLEDSFRIEYLDMAAKIRSEEYYVNMMIAWLFATALAKQWDSTIKYLENNKLDAWTHNKTIQKARESYRISKEQKEYLKTLKK